MTDVQERLAKLQQIEQHGQQLMVQRQGVQAQLIEVESALEELEGSSEAWRIIGNVMVSADVEKLSGELAERRDKLRLRIEAIEKHEERLREKARSIQEESRGPERDA